MSRLRRPISEVASHPATRPVDGTGEGGLPENQYFTDDALNNPYFTDDAKNNNYVANDT